MGNTGVAPPPPGASPSELQAFKQSLQQSLGINTGVAPPPAGASPSELQAFKQPLQQSLGINTGVAPPPPGASPSELQAFNSLFSNHWESTLAWYHPRPEHH